jgi:hypothetical protein
MHDIATIKRKVRQISFLPVIHIFMHKREKEEKHQNNWCFHDPYGIRTRVTAVKGRCLNHLTNGPRSMAEKAGFEPARRKTAT